jgi:hypothetical protein
LAGIERAATTGLGSDHLETRAGCSGRCQNVTLILLVELHVTRVKYVFMPSRQQLSHSSFDAHADFGLSVVAAVFPVAAHFPLRPLTVKHPARVIQ